MRRVWSVVLSVNDDIFLLDRPQVYAGVQRCRLLIPKSPMPEGKVFTAQFWKCYCFGWFRLNGCIAELAYGYWQHDKIIPGTLIMDDNRPKPLRIDCDLVMKILHRHEEREYSRRK